MAINRQRILFLTVIAAATAIVFSAAWAVAEPDRGPAGHLNLSSNYEKEAEEVDPEEAVRRFVGETCDTIESEARAHRLPPGFFARLIWTESRFNPNAVSPKGAQGIAQFMPATAEERGLADPFDPKKSLSASAAYLRDLKDRFGNLGLAAAAYNAGPDRVRRWRENASLLPRETRYFVRSITGLSAQEWADEVADEPDFLLHETKSFSEACRSFASLAKPRFPSNPIDPAIEPWGALIASNLSKSGAQAKLEQLADAHELIATHAPVELLRRPNPHRGGKLMYRVTLGADSLSEARKLCVRLRQTGAACMAVRN